MPQTCNGWAGLIVTCPHAICAVRKPDELKAHIHWLMGRALFNQEKSKLMQTKG